MAELTGRCIQCDSEIVVDLGDNDEVWAQKNLITHDYKCPTCKILGNFIECVKFSWSITKLEHILTKSEVQHGLLEIAGNQYRMFYPLMIHMPPKIDIYVRRKKCHYTLGKYTKRCKFVVRHPCLKKFKPHDIISIEVGRSSIRVRKI